MWIVKNEWDEYLTESTPGCAYFSEEQREAKRFTDQGKAYRVARRWSLPTVIRLVPKAELTGGPARDGQP